jgi:cyclohexa-1,5-dienecarbonyl-CoA hydratase
MSGLEYFKFEKANGCARIWLARPKHNVLNLPMMKELNSVLESLCADDELKCVLILGEGRSWCAGVEVADHKPESAPEMIETFDRIFDLLGRLDVPVIAAVHGACLGGGMELAIGCDMVIASPNAKFGQPEIKLGFFPPYAAARLPEMVGTSKAIEICTTGRTYTARESLELGFVSKVTDEDKFSETVDGLVDEICANSPLIIRMNKRAIKMVKGCEPREAAKKSNDYFLNSLMKTEDTLEGIKSFEEKRKPVWKNR